MMTINWSNTYTVEYEYWVVNPDTYRNVRKLAGGEGCSITEDAADETLGSATMTLWERIEAETWVRVVLLVTQDGRSERIPLGTFIAMSPTESLDYGSSTYPVTMFTPLKELADDGPPDGYAAKRGANAIAEAKRAMSRFHVRVKGCTETRALPRQIVALNDSWLSFGRKVLEAVDMEPTLDADGMVGFAPIRDAAALAPAWTFVDDDRSILGSELRVSCDWGAIPNTLKVVLSGATRSSTVTISNESGLSPVSTVSRGRVVSAIENNPEGITTVAQAQSWGRRKLKELSIAERTLGFDHGYCPVRLGDCVRVVKLRQGFDQKMKITRRTIKCETDLMVSAEGKYTEGVWNE